MQTSFEKNWDLLENRLRLKNWSQNLHKIAKGQISQKINQKNGFKEVYLQKKINWYSEASYSNSTTEHSKSSIISS